MIFVNHNLTVLMAANDTLHVHNLPEVESTFATESLEPKLPNERKSEALDVSAYAFQLRFGPFVSSQKNRKIMLNTLRKGSIID